MTDFDNGANFANGVIQAITDVGGGEYDVTLLAADYTLFDDAPYNCTCWLTDRSHDNAEIVRVISKDDGAHKLRITRAEEDSVLQDIEAGWFIGNTMTRKVITDIQDALALVGATKLYYANACGQAIDIATGGFIAVDGITTDDTMTILVLTSTGAGVNAHKEAGLYQPQAGPWIRISDWDDGQTKKVCQDVIIVQNPTGGPLGSAVASLENIYDGVSSNEEGIVGTDRFTFAIMRRAWWNANPDTGDVYDAFGTLTISATDGSVFVNAPITTDPDSYPPGDTSFVTKSYVDSAISDISYISLNVDSDTGYAHSTSSFQLSFNGPDIVGEALSFDPDSPSDIHVSLDGIYQIIADVTVLSNSYTPGDYAVLSFGGSSTDTGPGALTGVVAPFGIYYTSGVVSSQLVFTSRPFRAAIDDALNVFVIGVAQISLAWEVAGGGISVIRLA